ncbi:hypothetical protein CRV24_000570 [Beauveria bassiana]|nr:hypothetical protein CRV24_000570 [Beauveria bassiana]
MPVYSNRAQVALLKAVNHVFSLDRKADSLEDLTNGIILANILHELDAEFDPSHLESNPATSRYLTNKRNIQAVYKGLFRFIRRQIPELGCQAQRFDYHAVAENPEPQGLSQLHEDMEAVMEARDMDLVVEEQNAALRQQLDINKKALSDYITRLEHLQQSHEELKYEKERNDRELEVLRKATKDGANNAEAIRLLEDQVHEQMEIIAKNEESIRNHERARAQFETEVQKLTQRSQHADELRDQATEWRHKAEELEKKANAAERYKQKLESQQHLVKEVQNLQYERAELQEQLRSLMDEREKGDRTRKAEDELTRILQDELNSASSDDGQKNIPLELSRFKAENDLLRRTIGSAGDAATLRKEADDEKKQRERLQQSLNELFEKHTIVQHQIEALMQSSTGESSKAFIELRSEHTRTQNELQQLKKRTADLQVKLADKDRDLMGAKTELSAVQKDGISALDQLKSTDKLISESLKAELDRLREELAFVSNERESQKTQLIDALLAKDKFRKDAEEAKELQETAALSTANQDSSGAAKKAAEKIEKLRNRLIERKQQLEQAEQDKIDLQRELKVLQGGELATAQKAATEKMIKNLQRENVLIATAWYDLTSRLQSNHVVLQRRHDAPKSWLNKQRQMVHGQLRQRDMLYLY